jgi:hypothetical protein
VKDTKAKKSRFYFKPYPGFIIATLIEIENIKRSYE